MTLQSDGSQEIKIVESFFAALNRNDMKTLLGFLSDDFLRVEFEGTPNEGRFHGRAEVEPHFVKARATWAEGACTPQNFSVVNEKIIVSVHVRVRLKEKTEWIDGNVTDTFRIRNGQIIEMRSFLLEKDALEWARKTED